ncbi:hypothetical protein [Halobacteriaceae bacterium SHR40]|uniref:hypothetical protein n=1 Tax=Halovenus amylolytica TaxID=2500550 RepID=UPI000FE3E125
MARKLDRSGNRERLHSDNGEPPPERPRSGLTRRSYIELGATTVAALSVTAAANGSIRRHGIEFDRIKDAVDDLGVDPTGGAAVDEQIARAGDGTLVQFPDGEYRLDPGALSFEGGTRGFEAVGEQVSFHTSGTGQGFLIDGQGMDAAYVDGIDLDQRQSVTGLRLSGDRVVVQNVDVSGRPSGGGGLPLLAHATLSTGGRSRIRNLTASAGGGHRPLGRPGIFVEDDHVGTLTVQNCDLRRFPEGAVHAARHSGRVHVQDSYFENNALSIRLSGSGSSIENCSVVVEEFPRVDPGTDTEPYRFHGVSVATAGSEGSTATSQPVRISDSRFRIEQVPASVPAIVIPSAGSALEVVESRIEYNNTGRSVVLGRRPGPDPAGVRPLRMQQTTIAGDGSVDSVVELANADGSELESSRILIDQGDGDGIRLRDSADCRVGSTDITVPGRAAVFTDATVETLALSGGPDSNSAAGDRSPGTDTLVIDGAAVETTYEFTVDGRIDPEADSCGYPASGANSESVVGYGTDRYTVEGEITDLCLDGAGTVYLNGRQVDPATFDSGYPHELVFDPGTGPRGYEFAVTELSPWGRPATGNQLAVPGRTAVDSYRFDGTVDSLSVQGTATVTFGRSDRH